MVLGLAGNGDVVTNGSEQQIINQSSVNHYATYIFTDNMQAGDQLTIRVYILDNEGIALKKYLDIALNGIQLSPAVFIPFIPTGQYRVTVQRTGGVDRTYNWEYWTA
jgi:hypothetical protein